MKTHNQYNHYITNINSSKLILTPQHITYLENEGFTRKNMANFANKSERTIYRWNKQIKKEQKQEKPKRGRKLKIDKNTLELLLVYDEKNNTATLRDIADYLYQQTGKIISQSTIFRVLKKENISLKKAEKQYSEQDEEKIKKFVDENR
jgi:transposase